MGPSDEARALAIKGFASGGEPSSGGALPNPGAVLPERQELGTLALGVVGLTAFDVLEQVVDEIDRDG